MRTSVDIYKLLDKNAGTSGQYLVCHRWALLQTELWIFRKKNVKLWNNVTYFGIRFIFIVSEVQCKAAVTPLLRHWSYRSLHKIPRTPETLHWTLLVKEVSVLVMVNNKSCCLTHPASVLPIAWHDSHFYLCFSGKQYKCAMITARWVFLHLAFDITPHRE